MMGKTEKELVKQCSQLSLTSSSIDALLNIRNYLGINNTWTTEQLRYITKEGNVMCTLMAHSNTAEKLVSLFGERTDVKYLHVTFKPCNRLLLITGV